MGREGTNQPENQNTALLDTVELWEAHPGTRYTIRNGAKTGEALRMSRYIRYQPFASFGSRASNVTVGVPNSGIAAAGTASTARSGRAFDFATSYQRGGQAAVRR